MRFLIFFICTFISFSVISEEYYISEIKFYGLKAVKKTKIIKALKESRRLIDREVFARLVETKLFDSIKLTIKEGKLNIYVKERPYIKKIYINGTKPSREMKLLHELNIRIGGLYEHALLKIFKDRIMSEKYDEGGADNTKIKIKIKKDEKDNSIEIYINIEKNNLYKIKKIEIIGNKTFSRRKILSMMNTSDSKWMGALNKSNMYSKLVFSRDIKHLKDFYKDRGYIDFKVNYVKVILDKNKKYVSIYLKIDEGSRHKFGKIHMQRNFPKFFEDFVLNIIKKHIKENDVYSRKAVLLAKREISKKIEHFNFSNPKVDFKIINTDKDTVNFFLKINAIKKLKIRKVFILGNIHTNDLVIRNIIRQMEESYIDQDKITVAKSEIIKANLAKEVSTRYIRHPNNKYDVDIVFELKEHSVNKMVAGVTYSEKDGLTFTVESEIINVLGTGKDIIINLLKNNILIDCNVTLVYPNLYKNRIDLSLQWYYRKEIAKRKANANLCSDLYGYAFIYSYKVRKNAKLHFLINTDKMKYSVPGIKNVPQLKKFASKYGLRYRETALTITYITSSINRLIFPTKGKLSKMTIKVTPPKSIMKYYILSYDLNQYTELSKDLILNFMLHAAYGNKFGDMYAYPFFRQFLLKGKNAVRGYKPKILGPRPLSKKLNLGGNVAISLKTSIFLPLPILNQITKMRTGLFFDIGNVYHTIYKLHSRPYGYPKKKKFNSFLKYSCGLNITWHTPIGVPIDIIIAYPFKAHSWEKKEFVGFSIGLRHK